jgi:hypothetical protein
MTPYVVNFEATNDPASTRIGSTSDPIPNGQRFVVEHLSGYLTVRAGDSPDRIWASDGHGQDVYIPTHFVSRDLNWGGDIGLIHQYQFGSPIRMYVDEGRSVTLTADSNSAVHIVAVAVGHLEPM